MMVFDLDPGPPANIVQCCQVGLWLREIFEHFGLQSFPEDFGIEGAADLRSAQHSHQLRSDQDFFSRAGAIARARTSRDLVVSDMKKQVRTGKVFVDWSQNDEHKTTVAVYSLRAREHPTVSTPVTWEEVERALKKKDANLLVFEAKQVVARVEKMGDLFAPVLELKQRLPDLKGMAAAKTEAPEHNFESRRRRRKNRSSSQSCCKENAQGNRGCARQDARYNPVRCCSFASRG